MGKLVDFNEYFKKYFDKNIQIVFGDNLLSLSFENESEIKVDGIILEQDAFGIITDEEEEELPEYDDLEWLEQEYMEQLLAYSELKLGTAYIENMDDVAANPPTIYRPLKVRVVVFDLSAREEEDIYRYRDLVRAYMEAFRIMSNYKVKKIRLRPLGIYYSFVPMEDSVRAILRALDNFVFEKVYLTVRNREEAEKLWSYIIPFVEKKEKLRREKNQRDGN